MPRRFFSNTVAKGSLSSGVGTTDTTLFLSAGFGPMPSFPFYITIDRGTASVEVCLATGGTTSALQVTRAYDGTTAFSHGTGAAVQHVIAAEGPNTWDTHVNTGVAQHGLAGNVVGTTDTQALTNKTISSSVYSSAHSTSPSSSQGFIVPADTTAARDGYVFNNSGGSTGNAFRAIVAGVDRLDIDPNGKVIANSPTASDKLFQAQLSGATNAFIQADGTTSVAGLTSGTHTVNGNETVSGTLGVTGAATLSSTLAVTGSSTLTGAVTGSSTGTFTGSLTEYNSGVPVLGAVSATGNVTTPVTGQLVYVTTDRTIRRYNGSTWDIQAALNPGDGYVEYNASSSQSIAHNTVTKVQFPNGNPANTNYVTPSGTGNTDFTLVPGRWTVSASTTYLGEAVAGDFNTWIGLASDSGTRFSLDGFSRSGASSSIPGLVVSRPMRFATTTVLSIYTYQFAGDSAAHSLTPSSGTGPVVVNFQWVGP